MFSRLNSPASGTKSKDQKIVRNAITRVIDQALVIRLDRGRYVFGQTTSDGAGAGLARSVIGSGSMVACTAICCEKSAVDAFKASMLCTHCSSSGI